MRLKLARSPAFRNAADQALSGALYWAVPLAVVLLALLQLRRDGQIVGTWNGWADQELYVQAARAWAHGHLDPSLHHYPPGYALIAAPFVYLTPSQPFLVPDLMCSGGALILFTRVARRMAPCMPHVDAAAALSFLVSTAVGGHAVNNWVVPWTTTPAAPLLLLCLLFALRYDAGGKPRDLSMLGLAGGLCAMVRPTDAALVFAICSVFCAVTLLASRPGYAAVIRGVLWLAGGLLLGLLPGIAAHLLVHGFSTGGYVGGSAAVGFEWRLIPLRWVTLAISPRPLFPQGTGMLAVFPWLLPGIGGMMFSAASKRPPAAANRLVAVTVCCYWLLYLSYRDLHTYGLWRFHNIHYFKWTFPFLAFWTVVLARAIVASATRWVGLAALAAATLLFCWRPEFVPEARGVEATDGVHAAVPGGLSAINQVFKLPADGDWRKIYFDHGVLSIAGQRFSGVGYFKLFPAADGFMLMPLRMLPPGDTSLAVPDGVRLPAQAAWQSGVARLQFGVPCVVTPRLGNCKPVADRVRQSVAE